MSESSLRYKNLSEKFDKDGVRHDFDAVSEEIESESEQESSDLRKNRKNTAEKRRKPAASILKGRNERTELKKTTRFTIDKKRTGKG